MGLLVIVFIAIVVGIAIVNSKQNTCKEFVSDEKKEIIKESNNRIVSDVDEIKRFKELLESGTITQEEYDKKKKEILNL